MSTGNSTAWDWVPLKSLLVEVKEPVEVLDDHVYDLVSVRRRNGGVFHREALPGRKILTKKLNRAYPNTFLIARMQVVHGACAVVSERFRNSYISDSYLSYKPKPELHLGFMDWLSRTPLMYDHFLKSSHGVIIEKMTFDEDEWLRKKIPLPPLPEQKKIAEILSSVDDLIEKTERLIAKLKELKKAMLQELLTKGIGHTKFKDSPVGRIPEEWVCQKIEEVCDEITVGIVIRPTRYYTESGVPLLRSLNVTESGLDLTDVKFMSATDNETEKKSQLRAGDVVTVRTGRPGVSCAIPDTPLGFNCVDLIISRPSTAIIPAYLALWMNSDFGKGHVDQRQGGLAQQHFNVGEMKEMLIALPHKGEQHQIVDCATGANSRIQAQERKLGAFTNLKSALMQDLLTGKVRVKV